MGAFYINIKAPMSRLFEPEAFHLILFLFIPNSNSLQLIKNLLLGYQYRALI